MPEKNELSIIISAVTFYTVARLSVYVAWPHTNTAHTYNCEIGRFGRPIHLKNNHASCDLKANK